jgi:phosphate/sulfate permease
MSEYYLIIVGLLFLLAIADLIVGVSNDAVNFLNSSIGSKVAPLRTIMVVASLGILVGATFSSGMMEIARKGIFNPSEFYFNEIMIIFLAVMITDILLLDFFNTIGLPTSTTVSIVFELLGASFLISIIKINQNGEGLAQLSEYLNTTQATLIIAGIFISIVIAFTTGAFTQFVSRLIFSFKYLSKGIWATAIWIAIALTSMTFFLFFKGLKGASFINEQFYDSVSSNFLLYLLITFSVWFLAALAMKKSNINPFKIVVLIGTFSLAMAFSGNDLVNFIGVPIAGFESFLAWKASGIGATEYTMEVLANPVQTKTYLLVIAGIIMIVTLWFSKKARSVTETEVNLGRQGTGNERFKPNALARGMVRYSIKFSQNIERLIPQKTNEGISKQFKEFEIVENKEAPAFDLVRAGVNLTTASVLIAIATNFKLPLSTTYVSFMVAMGTSLADKAWGRDSAAYRVAGVLNVIMGWFGTAIIAFTVSALIALLIYNFELFAVIALLLLAIAFIYRSFNYHKSKSKEETQDATTFSNHPTELSDQLKSRNRENIRTSNAIIQLSIDALLDENIDGIKHAVKKFEELKKQNTSLQFNLHHYVKGLERHKNEISKKLLDFYKSETDMLQSVEYLVFTIEEYLKNSFSPLKAEQMRGLMKVKTDLERFISSITNKNDFREVMTTKQNDLSLSLKELEVLTINGISNNSYSQRNSQLVFKLITELKDLSNCIQKLTE